VPGILGKNQVGLLEQRDRTDGKIGAIADRGADNVEAGFMGLMVIHAISLAGSARYSDQSLNE
jgi:hypothetical protein